MEIIPFAKLPEFINRFMSAPDPLVLWYNLNPAAPPPERPQAWDVEVKMEDSMLKHRMTTMLQSTKENAVALSKLDEEVGCSSRMS